MLASSHALAPQPEAATSTTITATDTGSDPPDPERAWTAGAGSVSSSESPAGRRRLSARVCVPCRLTAARPASGSPGLPTSFGLPGVGLGFRSGGRRRDRGQPRHPGVRGGESGQARVDLPASLLNVLLARGSTRCRPALLSGVRVLALAVGGRSTSLRAAVAVPGLAAPRAAAAGPSGCSGCRQVRAPLRWTRPGRSGRSAPASAEAVGSGAGRSGASHRRAPAAPLRVSRRPYAARAPRRGADHDADRIEPGQPGLPSSGDMLDTKGASERTTWPGRTPPE